MAQARKHGREYGIDSTVQTIHIPAGVEHAGQTLINDGTSDIFWREIDPALIGATGAAATLVATPLFFSRLMPGESTHLAGIDIYAICDTNLQESSTLRVAPGRLSQNSDVDLAAMATDLAKATADAASTLYDGGDTANALRDTIATSALPAGAAVIDCDGVNAIDISLFGATATEAATLIVAEYSAATPTIATLTRQTPIPYPTADQDRTVDRACVGLATGVEIYAKSPVRVAVRPGSYVQLSIVQNLTGPHYARYQLHGSV